MKNTNWLTAACFSLLLVGSLLAFSPSPSPRGEKSPAEPACCKVRPNDCPGTDTRGEMIHESLFRQLL